MQPCALHRIKFIHGTHRVGSNQALPRHTKLLTQCCFRQDLARFMSIRCVGPNLQHHFYGADYTKIYPPQGFNPATANCRLQGIANSPFSTANLKLAERRGFEPLIRFLVYTLSRRAPSAARSSLQTSENHYNIKKLY